MALIKCDECGRDVSDKAAACPNCGAPVVSDEATAEPEKIVFAEGKFYGSRRQIIGLVIQAIQNVGYRVDSANDEAGLVSFTTGMTWGSWSGVSGSVFITEVGLFAFEASGTAKQNVKGGQMVALDLFGESKSKVNKVIGEMTRIVT